jgi:hypothetical protein
MRVLRPGGRLALTDGLPLPGQAAPGFRVKMVLKRWAYPAANFYDRERYATKLVEAGFVNVQVTSIREHVFPGLSRYAELRRAGVSMGDAVVALNAEDVSAGLGVWESLGVSDYVIVTADKPT